MSQQYTDVAMTDKARRSLLSAYDGLISDMLRGGLLEPESYEENAVIGVPTRNGESLHDFFHDLGLSIDKVPNIMLNKRLSRLEEILARLDRVDGTRDEWGVLAQSLLDGLEIEMDKRSTVEKFPHEDWSRDARKGK